jgi:hypothetical protein
MMERSTLPLAVAEALEAAGATKEMVAAVSGTFAAWQAVQRAKATERQRACRARKREREALQRDVTTPQGEADILPDIVRDQIAGEDLLQALSLAGRGNFDISASFVPIRALLDQGCDLQADILPVIAREVPELQRPLKNWGVAWLARDILAARDRRVHGVPPSVEHFDPEVVERVEAPPPVQRTPAIAWDEFVAGHRAGLIEWNVARLGPVPWGA